MRSDRNNYINIKFVYNYLYLFSSLLSVLVKKEEFKIFYFLLVLLIIILLLLL